MYGARNPKTPSYVERMAYEMDRAAGRFKASIDQYRRYYEEAIKKGDQVSANIAKQKLYDIYTNKCIEILQEAAKLYMEENDQFPSPRMQELVQQGYLKRVIMKKAEEEPGFMEEVAPVLMPHGDIRELLTNWDGSEPHLFITYTTDEDKKDWYISSRSRLVEEQKGLQKQLQQAVDKYKEEKGKLPEKLSDIVDQPWYGAEKIYDDPLGGEFYLDHETGKVKARNPKY